MQTIHCDMDDVLVDFEGFKAANLSPMAQYNDDVMWEEFRKIPNFYQKMRPLPYARRLWQAILDTGMPNRLLTAVSLDSDADITVSDKEMWVEINRNLVFCNQPPEVYPGPRSCDKWRHAGSLDILIDDRSDNCVQWEIAGGIAINHTGDVERTLQLLKAAVQRIRQST